MPRIHALVGLALLLLVGACANDRAKPAARDAGAVAPLGCEVVRGSWRVEGFAPLAGEAPDRSRALEAQMNDEARAIRIAYTGTRVKMWSPGSLLISNGYVVRQDAPGRCVLDVNGERADFEIVDRDHLIVDRGAAKVGARMRLRRSHEAPPDAGPQ